MQSCFDGSEAILISVGFCFIGVTLEFCHYLNSEKVFNWLPKDFKPLNLMLVDSVQEICSRLKLIVSMKRVTFKRAVDVIST